MADQKEEPDRLEQAREAFLYAPLGLLYEYDKVLPQLVRRGKSQVQLAKMVGKMATNKDNVEKGVAEVADGLSTFLAKGFGELGEFLGLAPDTQPTTPPTATATATETADSPKTLSQRKATSPLKTRDESPALPIAGYDSMTAKEIVRLLGDLSSNQRAMIRKHEEGTRARRTIISKLDRLDK